jgi:hypothetical protein
MKRGNMRGMLALHMAMAMMAARNPFFSNGRSTRTMSKEERECYEQEKRERAHTLNPVDLSEREFIINGERIMAHDKKTAKKIYERRHQDKKRRK